MIMGMSFSRGVLFHDRNVLACAEVKNGVIEVWSEKITLRTIGKLWVRVFFSFPWYYQLLHLLMLLYVIASAIFPEIEVLDPWWIAVYAAGFHFVFPRELKKFHGAEHKVFSHMGEKKLEAWEEIARADIVNEGCSTNLVVWFFTGFLLVLPFAPLVYSVGAGFAGILIAMAGDKWLRKYCRLLYRVSRFLQRYSTTREPNRIHLETAIRSYRQFEYLRKKEAAASHAA
ncbi:DUF1385 domain-containing protein [Brevibacillus ruminantium]|uniref:DUF1385 domain-containing protein n=1 Tax=Brevibacillus ruminantium TaxID=2950604 RepID=A0ABY4W9N6_9BACL|nr:DUF1385 domain-containing protein [Brevibacillus ruminantium]USG63768.1 DUF1385 domain-containing protein [Brevibacillus ruminantium]